MNTASPRGLSRLVALGVTLAELACGGAEERPDPLPDRAPDPRVVAGPVGEPAPGLTRPAGSLEWLPCGDGAAECATLEVPLDRNAPGDAMLSIALNRVRANVNPYRGVIILNPGGPGASGKDLVLSSADGLKAIFPGFDFVGFDPRGVGDSAGIVCAPPLSLLEAFTSGGIAAAIDSYRRAGSRCAEDAGPLFQHLGSQAVVEDIERIRVALGIEELNFLVASYGTRLGALYAATYPEHTRALVLDAPVAPRASLLDLVVGQHRALLRAHATFFDLCSEGKLDCPSAAEDEFARLLAEARELNLLEPFLAFWATNLTQEDGRNVLSIVLSLTIADLGLPPLESLMPSDESLNVGVNFTTHCTDEAPPGSSEATLRATLAEFESEAPDLFPLALRALVCSGWQVTPDPAPDLTAADGVRPLVIGGLNDPSTPFEWAQATTLATGGTLLTSQHEGHGAVAFGGACVFGAIRRYLETLILPTEGTSCPAP